MTSSPPTATDSPAEREVRPTSIAWRTDLPERPSSESRRRQPSLASSVGSVSLPTGSVRADRQRLLSSPPPPPLVPPIRIHPFLSSFTKFPLLSAPPLSSPPPPQSLPHIPGFLCPLPSVSIPPSYLTISFPVFLFTTISLSPEE